MFGKVIVFGLFEMIFFKKKLRTTSLSPGSTSVSSRVQRRGLSHGLMKFEVPLP